MEAEMAARPAAAETEQAAVRAQALEAQQAAARAAVEPSEAQAPSRPAVEPM